MNVLLPLSPVPGLQQIPRYILDWRLLGKWSSLSFSAAGSRQRSWDSMAICCWVPPSINTLESSLMSSVWDRTADVGLHQSGPSVLSILHFLTHRGLHFPPSERPEPGMWWTNSLLLHWLPSPFKNKRKMYWQLTTLKTILNVGLVGHSYKPFLWLLCIY